GIDSTPLSKRSVPVLPWLEEEDQKLTEAVTLYGWGNPVNIDWDKVSQHLNSERSADQCSRRWNSAIKYRRAEYKALPWSKEEDERLEEGVRRYHGQGLRGGIDWDKVKQEVGEQRSINQCRGRWNGILKHRSSVVRTTPWTKEEDELLMEAVGINERHGRRGSVKWGMVSQHLQGLRTAQQCSHRWNRVLRTAGVACSEQPWTAEEDERLREAAQEFYGQGLRGGVDWLKVTERMGGERTPQQYGHRWNRVVKLKGTVLRNTPWTSDEDERMLELVALYEGQGLRGAVDWGKVSESMGGTRTPQQCCHRWCGVLRHRTEATRVSAWTPDEDSRLSEAVHLFANQGLRGGVCWGRVSEYINHERTAQQCSHRWNRVLRNRGHPGTNTSWTEEEDAQLREAVQVFEGQGLRGGVDWGKVSAALKGNRTQQQYCTRWNRVLKNGHVQKALNWSDAEDQKLVEAVNIYRGSGRGGTVDWVKVCEYMGAERTREQYCGRWNGVMKHRDSKGAARDNAELPVPDDLSGVPVATSSSVSSTVNAGIVGNTAPSGSVNAPDLYQI
ncbi:mybL, partial [Symbiodinium microadriaticum]